MKLSLQKNDENAMSNITDYKAFFNLIIIYLFLFRSFNFC